MFFELIGEVSSASVIMRLADINSDRKGYDICGLNVYIIYLRKHIMMKE